MIIDVDGPDGHAKLIEFQKQCGQRLPPTFTCVSGSAEPHHYHLYFRLPTGMQVLNKPLYRFAGLEEFTGIDVRSHRGQVAAPGTPHRSGHRYQWDSGECYGGLGKPAHTNDLPEAPAWLLSSLGGLISIEPYQTPQVQGKPKKSHSLASEAHSIEQGTDEWYLRIICERWPITGGGQRNNLQGKPISAATINKDLRAIRAAMHFAVDRGYVTECPKFRSAMLREDKPAPVVIPQNDRQSIYDAVKSVDIELRVRSAAWWFVLLTVIDQLGVRRNEALGLKWADINFDTNEATVHAASSKGRRYRTLPMSERLVVVLRDWRDVTPSESTDAILPWEKNTLRPFYDDWNRILEKAGLPQDTRVVPKHFRSTCGSELIEAGASTMAVKDFLGHASVTTTESHYINTASSLKIASKARERLIDSRRAS